MFYHLWVGLLKSFSHSFSHVNDFLPFFIMPPCAGLVWRFSWELAGLFRVLFLIQWANSQRSLGLGKIFSILFQEKQAAILVPPGFMAELRMIQMQLGLAWSTAKMHGDRCISWSPWKALGMKRADWEVKMFDIMKRCIFTQCTVRSLRCACLINQAHSFFHMNVYWNRRGKSC